MSQKGRYDALLLASFGGPERPEDVQPFLEAVTAGKDVPESRLQEVAEHYELFGGVSPINTESRGLLAAIVQELNTHGPSMAIYWGNRFWHPTLTDVVQQMADDDIRSALVFSPSLFESPASNEAYAASVAEAAAAVEGAAPTFTFLPTLYKSKGYIEPAAARVVEALAEIDGCRRGSTVVLFTAHNLPVDMADHCPYADQFLETCRLVAERLELSDNDWTHAFQSRSGRPSTPWLTPSAEDRVTELAKSGKVTNIAVVPIGFLLEHMEVVYDLDVELAAHCESLGVPMVRARTVGCDPMFVSAIREQIELLM